MASIAVLGSGRVGQALAPKLAAAGHEVVVGSRDPEASADKFKESGVRVASVKDAIAIQRGGYQCHSRGYRARAIESPS